MKQNRSRIILGIMLVVILCASCKDFGQTKNYSSLLEVGHELETESQKVVENTDSVFSKNEQGPHYGMDISHFQGDIVSKLKSTDELSFIICKATEGDYFVDPEFRSNWNEIKEKGLIRGTYHFYDCKYDPIKQANHFTTTVGHISDADIAPVLDIEQGSMRPDVSAEQMEKDILVFLKTVEKTLNRKPILYTDYAFAQEYLSNSEFANYELWLAEYTSVSRPKVPNTWSKKGFKIWQKSASYKRDSETTDLDVYFGELSDLVN